mmetsp:Transcript_40762/g.109423  ORF Transcript_40762/g.109423 Transcript_40762/m.109423 type:complete len:220 (-) Transcript_40762:592-1251(-)
MDSSPTPTLSSTFPPGPPQRTVPWEPRDSTGPLSRATISTPWSSSRTSTKTALWKYWPGRKLFRSNFACSAGLPRSHWVAEARRSVPDSRRFRVLGRRAARASEVVGVPVLYLLGIRHLVIQRRSTSSVWALSLVALNSASRSANAGPSCPYSLSHISSPSPTSEAVKRCPSLAPWILVLSADWASRSSPSTARWSTAAMVQVSPASSSRCSWPSPQPQ